MKVLVSTLLITLLILPIAFAETDTKHACGAASLYHLATLLELQVSLDTADAALKAKEQSSRVANFAELIDCGKTLGLTLQGVKLTYAELQTLDTPVIAHLKTTFDDENPVTPDESVGHFIVVEHANDKWVRLFDSPQKTLRKSAIVVSKDRFLELWTGKTLVLSQKQQDTHRRVLNSNYHLNDLGNGKPGEYVIIAKLRNERRTPLKIRSIAANCDCTITKQQARVIPVDDFIFLDIIWDASVVNRSLFTTIHIETEARHRPHTFISLGLIREFSLVCIPETLSLRGSGTTNIKRTVALQNLNETATKILKMEASAAWIQPVLRSNTRIPPWRQANIELHFEAAQLPRGKNVDETFTVHYQEGSGETKTLILPISGKVNSRYVLTPNRFFFGRIKATEENIKAVVFNNQSGTDLQIEKIDTDVGTVQVNALADQNRYELRLTLPPRLPRGILKGEVRIHTNAPNNSLIKVPVFGIVVK